MQAQTGSLRGGVGCPAVWDGLTPPYMTIVVDPPWPYTERLVGFSDVKPMPYSTMTIEDIAAMSVRDLASPNAKLFLWTTNTFIWDCREILRGWGFEPTQLLTWCKNAAAPTGGNFFSTTEFIVYARRWNNLGRGEPQGLGAAIRDAREAAGMSRAELHRAVRNQEPNGMVYRWEFGDSIPTAEDWSGLVRALPALNDLSPPTPIPRNKIHTSWFQWPRSSHSTKPAAFFDMVEETHEGPYVELFSRQPRLGWDAWGKGFEMETENAV